jgi:hypothetical protein
VVNVVEFTVERLDGSVSGGQLRSEKFIACQGDLVETRSFWNMGNMFGYLKGFIVWLWERIKAYGLLRGV